VVNCGRATLDGKTAPRYYYSVFDQKSASVVAGWSGNSLYYQSRAFYGTGGCGE
jgi:hypothetical protein